MKTLSPSDQSYILDCAVKRGVQHYEAFGKSAIPVAIESMPPEPNPWQIGFVVHFEDQLPVEVRITWEHIEELLAQKEHHGEGRRE